MARKTKIKFTDFECNLLINGMNEFRNMLLAEDLPTEDVDELLLKIIPYIKENIDLSKFSPISYLESGDVVFADTAEDYTVGKATKIQSENKVFILSGLHTIPCRPIIKFHKGYLGHYFNSSAYRTDILPLIQGTKVSSISKTELLKTSVVVPPLEQQRKVAKLLSAFDNKITNLELEVAKLVKLKSGLLQQLFI